jgi:hypothetical protein
MLKEVKTVRQVAGEHARRWFAAEAVDLIVWVDAAGAPVGFQLCYDRGGAEKALTWSSPDRFSHMAVDDGEGRAFRHKGTPILVPGGSFDGARVAKIFRAESAELPAGLARLIAAKIAEFGRRGRAPRRRRPRPGP